MSKNKKQKETQCQTKNFTLIAALSNILGKCQNRQKKVNNMVCKINQNISKKRLFMLLMELGIKLNPQGILKVNRVLINPAKS